MKAFLDYHYFSRNDEENNNTFGVLSCVQTRLLKIMNNTLSSELFVNIFELFLDDQNYYIKLSDSGELINQGLLNNYSPKYNELFKLRKYEDRGITALEKVVSELDNGKFVFLHTMAQRVPFYIGFQGFDSTPTDITTHHFLLIHYENEYFYYAEAPWMMYESNFVSYKNNESIGLIHKNDLYPAATMFCNYIVLESMNFQNLLDSKFDLIDYIKLQCAVYFRPNSNKLVPTVNNKESNNRTYIGQEAILKMIREYKGKKIHYDDKLLCDRNTGLFFFIYKVLMKRKRLLKAIETSSVIHDDQAKNIVELLLENIKLWELLKNHLTKNIVKKQDTEGDVIHHHLTSIKDYENKLFENLSLY